jgi:hypothetical protein
MNKLYLEIYKVAYIFLTKLLLSSLANLAPFELGGYYRPVLGDTFVQL